MNLQLTFNFDTPDTGETPQERMARTFQAMKGKHPDALLLFRNGDNYEAHGSDAKAAAQILNLPLEQRRAYYCKLPYYALDTYLPKLVRAGKRVAICDLLTKPESGKLVKRGATELRPIEIINPPKSNCYVS